MVPIYSSKHEANAVEESQDSVASSLFKMRKNLGKSTEIEFGFWTFLICGNDNIKLIKQNKIFISDQIKEKKNNLLNSNSFKLMSIQKIQLRNPFKIKYFFWV